MAKIGVGMVGAGWMAGQHLDELVGREDVELRGIADPDPRRAADLAARCGAKAYASWGELLDAGGIEALWVCTPPAAHAEVVLPALERRIPVYLEKPVARSLADGRLIADAAARAGVVCAVGYQWHSLDLLASVRELLADRPVGLVLCRNLGPTEVRPWFLRRAAGGGNVLERASHHFDLVRLVAGEVDAVTVATSSVALGGRPAGEGDVEDALCVVLHLASGGMATVLVAWLRDGMPGSYGLEIAADGVMLTLDLDPVFELHGVADGVPVRRAAAEPALRASIGSFVAAVRAADPQMVACSPADALRTLAVAAAAESSLASGRTERVGEVDGDGPRDR